VYFVKWNGQVQVDSFLYYHLLFLPDFHKFSWTFVTQKPPPKMKRSQRVKTKTQNFLVRSGDFEDSILAFFHDIDVPFTNNLAEQDSRLLTYRSWRGAFCPYQIISLDHKKTRVEYPCFFYRFH